MDMRFVFTGLTPYTRYNISVRAKAAGELGPAAWRVVITPSEGENARNLTSAHAQFLVYFYSV